MPYISKKQRKNFDPLIDELAKKIVEASKKENHDAAFAGFLNYIFTRLALKVIRLRFGKMRYWIIAVLTGVFENAKQEFYRRIASPYEDKQIAKNGDVDEYKNFKKEIEKL